MVNDYVKNFLEVFGLVWPSLVDLYTMDLGTTRFLYLLVGKWQENVWDKSRFVEYLQIITSVHSSKREKNIQHKTQTIAYGISYYKSTKK